MRCVYTGLKPPSFKQIQTITHNLVSTVANPWHPMTNYWMMLWVRSPQRHRDKVINSLSLSMTQWLSVSNIYCADRSLGSHVQRLRDTNTTASFLLFR